jgi:predicted nucleic acid-binding protein
MVLVYSVLQGHPAQPACELLLRAQAGWFTSGLVLFEAKGVLTKVYGEHPAAVTRKLDLVANGPVVLMDLAHTDIITVLQFADVHALDLTDAALLFLAHQQGARFLATDDQHLSAVSSQLGITPLTPLNSSLRQAVAAWESIYVPPKGLPRVLRRVYQWLSSSHPQAAHDFWSQTGGGSHLP